MPETVSTFDLARELRKSPATIRKWIKAGLIPPPIVVRPKLWLWPSSVLEDLRAKLADKQAS